MYLQRVERGGERIMPARVLFLRTPTEEELVALERLPAKSRSARQVARRVEIIKRLTTGKAPAQIAKEMAVSTLTVYLWMRRFNEEGVEGLVSKPRPGRPRIYSDRVLREVYRAASVSPAELGLGIPSWTLDRLVKYLNDDLRIPISRTHLARLLVRAEIRWYLTESHAGTPQEREQEKKAV